jgi:hypothetical protein
MAAVTVGYGNSQSKFTIAAFCPDSAARTVQTAQADTMVLEPMREAAVTAGRRDLRARAGATQAGYQPVCPRAPRPRSSTASSGHGIMIRGAKGSGRERYAQGACGHEKMRVPASCQRRLNFGSGPYCARAISQWPFTCKALASTGQRPAPPSARVATAAGPGSGFLLLGGGASPTVAAVPDRAGSGGGGLVAESLPDLFPLAAGQPGTPGIPKCVPNLSLA